MAAGDTRNRGVVIRVSVCELPDNRINFKLAWPAFVQHVQFVESDIVVLPELPASVWFGRRFNFDQGVWDTIVAEHEMLVSNLGEFGSAIVIGSRAVTIGGRRHNLAFAWSTETGLVDLHAKSILPEEPGFHEQTWCQAGSFAHRVVTVGQLDLGVLLCSELMATDRSSPRLGSPGRDGDCMSARHRRPPAMAD